MTQSTKENVMLGIELDFYHPLIHSDTGEELKLYVVIKGKYDPSSDWIDTYTHIRPSVMGCNMEKMIEFMNEDMYADIMCEADSRTTAHIEILMDQLMEDQ